MKKNGNFVYKSTKVGIVKLGIILALVAIMAVSAVAIVKLNADVGVGTAVLSSDIQKAQSYSETVNTSDYVQNIDESDYDTVLAVAKDQGYIEILNKLGLSEADFYNSFINLLSETSKESELLERGFLWSGSEGHGWYSSNNSTGINYLNNEFYAWCILTGSVIAMGIAVLIASAIASGGLTLGVALQIIGWIAQAALLVWGNAKSALDCMSECTRKVSLGESYGFSRTYVLGITTGYNAW